MKETMPTADSLPRPAAGPSLAGACLAEFIGTALLILFGVGAVAGMQLSGANFGQWEISLTWGLGVALAVYVVAGVSGAHLNPAVTLALAAWAGFERRRALPYIVAQCAGAFCAAALVMALYAPLLADWESTHGIIRGTPQSVASAAIFTTFAHASLGNVQALLVEAVITAILMTGILALTDPRNGPSRGFAGALLIGLLVAVIGASFGPLTGFAMNPARDLGPRLFIALSGWDAVAFNGGRASDYWWVPVLGPLLGAQIGALLYLKLISPHLPR